MCFKAPAIATQNTTTWNIDIYGYLFSKHFANHEMTTSSGLSPVILKIFWTRAALYGHITDPWAIAFI